MDFCLVVCYYCLQPGERIDFSKYGVRKERKEVKVPGSLYCALVKRLEEKCAQHSLLEIWRYQEELINTTSTQEITAGVNLLQSSPWFSHPANFTSLLGGITRYRVEHSHWSRSVQILDSHWWNLTMLAPSSMP